MSAVQRLLFQKWSGFLRCFLAKSNLALFAPCGEPSVFDYDSDLSSAWRVLFSWLDAVKGFFSYHGENPLIIHHCCPPWTSRPFYAAELTSVFFFLRMYQTVDLAIHNDPAISFLVLKPKNGLFHLYGEILWLNDVGSERQLPKANVTLGINSRTFTCLIDVEITKE